MEKDYSLLRPFDLEAAKRGEQVAWVHDGSLSKQVVVLDSGKVVIEWADGQVQFYTIEEGDARFLRMAPLSWVEGKPVYKGDVLYYNGVGRGVVAGMTTDGAEVLVVYDNKPDWGPTGAFPENLTWTPPKVKREAWVNVYKNSNNAYRHDTKEMADTNARMMNGTIDPNRIACIHIEWEE